jgi:hypothetical protein
MSPSPSRARVVARPIGTSLYTAVSGWERAWPVPPQWEIVSEVNVGDDHGLMLRNLHTGLYAALVAAGGLKALPQRKALAAAASLDLQPQTASDPEEVADLLRGFLGRIVGTAATAEQLLGIPKRTAEGILQGKGFAYPKLLALAIQAFRSTPDAD